MTCALIADLLFTPLEAIEKAVVLVEKDHIKAVGSRDQIAIPEGAKVIDFGDSVLVPGFVDIHIHGGAGVDVMTAENAEMEAIERHLTQFGVTSFVPTTVTAPLERTLDSLSRLARLITRTSGRRLETRARPLALHLEGPFLSHDKRGVHPPEHLQKPAVDMFLDMWNAAHGNIAVVTLAPELEGAAELIAAAAQRGALVSMGHSNATQAEAIAGIEAGARHATHTFNAMRPLDHREPGIVGAVLSDGRVTADIIADGVHVDPAAIKMFLASKGEAGAILITDAISATGMPDGKYRLGGFEVEVANGRCQFEGKLAGSVLTMDVAIRNVMKFADWKLQQAVRLATYNPAKAIGMEKRHGVIAKGADADIVVLSRDGQVKRTIVAGVGLEA